MVKMQRLRTGFGQRKAVSLGVVVAIVSILVGAIIVTGPVLISVSYPEMGDWGNSYLHVTILGTQLVYLEVDYEDGILPSFQALTYLIEQFNLVSARQLVLRNDLVDNVGDAGEVIDDEVTTLYTSRLQALRDSPNNIFYIYIIYLDRTVNLGEGMTIGGLAPVASVIIIFEPAKQSLTLEKNILLHEMGHLFGLDHCNNPDCVMNPQVSLSTGVRIFCGECLEDLGVGG